MHSYFPRQRIATHTPHRGRNKYRQCINHFFNKLQLTRPTGDETTMLVFIVITSNELQLTRPTGDETGFGSGFGSGLNYCNSHAPQGTKRHKPVQWSPLCVLQLTRPTGDETNLLTEISRYCLIATHTPHRGRNIENDRIDRVMYCELQLTRPTGDETVIVRFAVHNYALQLTRPTGDETEHSGSTKFST